MGGRLMVRLTTQCNSGCAHCTIADIAHLPERSLESLWREIEAGRDRGCDELVFMRGEATLRKDLVKLVRNARRIGYTHVQLQTNGRMLAYPQYVHKLLDAGVTFFELSYFGHEAGLHDAVDGTPGAFEQALAGLRNLVERNAALLVTVPVVKRNVLALSDIVKHLSEEGVRHVQLNFSRPVKVGLSWNTRPLARLGEASPHIRAALREARRLGMVGSTEAVPFCHLDPVDRDGLDATEDFSRHEVVDVHRVESDLTEHRAHMRPKPAACQGCSSRDQCPSTWADYQRVFGTWELTPLQ